MKAILRWLPLFIVTASIINAIHGYRSNLNSIPTMAFDGEEIQERFLKEPVENLAKRIAASEQKGSYTLKEAFENESLLTFYEYRVTFNNDDPTLQEAYEVAPDTWWHIESLLTQSQELRKKYCGTPEQNERFEKLKTSTPGARNAWRFELRRVLSEYEAIPFQRRLFWSLIMLCVAVLLDLWQKKWDLKKLLPPVLLRYFGYLLTFGMVCISLPAVAMAQVVQKLKKQTAIAKIDSWSDRNYDRQQLLSFDAPIGKRLSLVILNQNRQSTDGKATLSYAGLGAKVVVATGLSVTAIVGPQIVSDAGRSASADSHVAFVNANYQSRTFSGLWLNRFQREHDGKNISAHRHVAAIRAGPLPSWLWLQAEIKRHKNRTPDSFWGTSMLVGQTFFKKNSWLKGLYLYPYYDFGRHGFDIRVGWSRTFAFN